MLMEYDDLHKEWTAEVRYDGIDGLHDEDDMRRIFGRMHEDQRTDLSRVGILIQSNNPDDDDDPVSLEDYNNFRTVNDALVEHLDVLFLENRIVWPKYNA